MNRLITTLLLVSTAAFAANAQGQQPVSPQALVQMEVRSPDHTIAYGSDPLQFGNLYLPSGPGPHPVLAFIHGGCFLSQFDITHSAPLSAALADAGIAVWSIEYRRVGDEGGGWPGTFLDVGRGLDHLGALADDFDLDLGRAVVGGHSAGGTLALWAAGRGAIDPGSEVHVADPQDFAAVFGLAAVGDLEAVQRLGGCNSVVDQLLGGTPVEVPTRYAAVSPMALAPLDAPVTFVVGADDPWTRPAMSWVYRARAVGSEDIEVVELPESGHFEMIAPTSSSWPAVVDALKRTFTEIGAGSDNGR